MANFNAEMSRWLDNNDIQNVLCFNFASLGKRIILANRKGLLLSKEEINADENSSLTLDLAGAVILGTEPYSITTLDSKESLSHFFKNEQYKSSRKGFQLINREKAVYFALLNVNSDDEDDIMHHQILSYYETEKIFDFFDPFYLKTSPLLTEMVKNNFQTTVRRNKTSSNINQTFHGDLAILFILFKAINPALSADDIHLKINDLIKKIGGILNFRQKIIIDLLIQRKNSKKEESTILPPLTEINEFLAKNAFYGPLEQTTDGTWIIKDDSILKMIQQLASKDNQNLSKLNLSRAKIKPGEEINLLSKHRLAQYTALSQQKKWRHQWLESGSCYQILLSESNNKDAAKEPDKLSIYEERMEVSFPLNNTEKMKNALFALAETMAKALENLPANKEKNIFITASTNEARHILEERLKEFGFKVTYNETKDDPLSQDDENEVEIGINDLKPSTPKQA